MNNPEILTPSQLITKKLSEAKEAINFLVEECNKELNQHFHDYDDVVTVNAGYAKDYVIQEVKRLFREQDWDVKSERDYTDNTILTFSRKQYDDDAWGR